MNTCPHHKVRPELPPLTPRITKLPIDDRGYPIPFFVQWVDEDNKPTPAGVGRPEFRMMDRHKWTRCMKESLCWVCGEIMGRYKAFTIGPMCTVNRVSSEPPAHLECADWSVRGCPFLSRPTMVRREDALTEENKHNTPGVMIERNPGVIAVWITRTYRPFKVPNGVLIQLGDPEKVEWFTLGRHATREEVNAAINAGLPTLLQACHGQEEINDLMAKAAFVVDNFLPVEQPTTNPK